MRNGCWSADLVIMFGRSVGACTRTIRQHRQYQLHRVNIDDTLSGTTACTVFFDGTEIHVANAGDSRAIVAEMDPVKGRLKAQPLSIDQTPYRKDERDRCKKAGARVLSMDQLEGLVEKHENWGLNLGEEIVSFPARGCAPHCSVRSLCLAVSLCLSLTHSHSRTTLSLSHTMLALALWHRLFCFL